MCECCNDDLIGIAKSPNYAVLNDHHQSTYNWKNAVMILKEGVGSSTLPITKLNAIVHAAKEVALLHNQQHKDDSTYANGEILLAPIWACITQNKPTLLVEG